MNTLARNALSWLRLAVVSAVLAIISPHAAHSQWNGGAEGLPNLMDEPVVVPTGVDPLNPTIVRNLFWPAFFGTQYTAGKSSVCVACEQAAGKYRMFRVDAQSTTQVTTPIGWFVPLSELQAVTWLPPSSRSETGTFGGAAYSATQNRQTSSVAALMVTDGGVWSVVSGTVDVLTTTVTTPAGPLGFDLQFFSLYRTHEDAAEAISWASDFATGEVFQTEEWRPTDGGEQGGEPDYAGYNECKGKAEDDRIDDRHAADLVRIRDEGELSITERVIFPAAVAGGVGAGGGFGLGSVCPLIGNVVGGIVGGGLGIVTGVVGGGLNYIEKWNDIQKTYNESIAAAERKYWAKIANCKKKHRIPANYD